jgi:hypothetical protein
MNKAITYVELFTEIESLLKLEIRDDTQVKFTLNPEQLPAFQTDLCILVAPENIPFEQIVNQGAHNEEVNMLVVCVKRDGHVDIDADFIDFLRWTQEVIKTLRGKTFHNRIIKPTVGGRRGFDTLTAGKQAFLHTATIEYSVTIKGVTDV